MGMLVCGAGALEQETPGGVPVPAGDACWVERGSSCFGGASWGRQVGQGRSSGKYLVGAHGVS